MLKLKYLHISQIDILVNNSHIFYQTWKYLKQLLGTWRVIKKFTPIKFRSWYKKILSPSNIFVNSLAHCCKIYSSNISWFIYIWCLLTAWRGWKDNSSIMVCNLLSLLRPKIFTYICTKMSVSQYIKTLIKII